MLADIGFDRLKLGFQQVEALLPRLDARLAITSGYLERDELKAPGWHRLERRDREGWAADLFERAGDI
jgi:hypothetical protein